MPLSAQQLKIALYSNFKLRIRKKFNVDVFLNALLPIIHRASYLILIFWRRFCKKSRKSKISYFLAFFPLWQPYLRKYQKCPKTRFFPDFQHKSAVNCLLSNFPLNLSWYSDFWGKNIRHCLVSWSCSPPRRFWPL